MGELLPWLRQLDCQAGHLQRYVEDNQICLNPLRAGDHNVDRLIDGMAQSSRIMGSRFRLPGMGLVIEQGRVRK